MRAISQESATFFGTIKFPNPYLIIALIMPWTIRSILLTISLYRNLKKQNKLTKFYHLHLRTEN